MKNVKYLHNIEYDFVWKMKMSSLLTKEDVELYCKSYFLFWKFQNKRAKLKKASGPRGELALQLMAQGLYNHSTVPPRGPDDDSDEDDDEC